MGIEPTSWAWKAYALPMCYTRKDLDFYYRKTELQKLLPLTMKQ